MVAIYILTYFRFFFFVQTLSFLINFHLELNNSLILIALFIDAFIETTFLISLLSATAAMVFF